MSDNRTFYQYMSAATRNIYTDEMNMVVSINRDDLEKDEYRFYWFGSVVYRGNTYHVEGHIIFLPFASADGSLLPDKYENGAIRFNIKRGDSFGETIYFNLNQTGRNILDGILSKLYHQIRMLLVNNDVINQADLVAINNLAYNTEVEAFKAQNALLDIKAKVRITELAFIKANNQYVRYTGSGELFNESLAG